MSKYTQKQIENWKEYEKVRREGRFNMFDPNARALTGLSREEYTFCIENYDALKQQAIQKAQEE